MKHFLILFVFGLIFLGSLSFVDYDDNSAAGLSCARSNMTNHFTSTDVIFLGKTLSKDYQPNPRHEDKYDAVSLFSISEPFKGIHQKQINVTSSEWFWGVNFTEGMEYVVFANYNEGKLEHTLCTPTQLASESDLESIRRASEDYVLTPHAQLRFGTDAIDIRCQYGLVLIQKYDDSPACVSPETKQKLIGRGGWTDIVLPYKESTTKTEKQDMLPAYTGSTDIPSTNNQFAMDFYSHISANDSKGNIFFSPTSIHTAFAIAYEGARGDTAAELQHTFGFEQDPDERRSGFSQMLNSYGKQNNERWKEKPYELKIANALWLAHEFEPKRQYVDTAVSYYNSTVESVDFVTDDGVNKINDWVKEKTKGKIKDVLAPGSTDELTRMAITNAMYFNGKWTSQFNPDNTVEREFWTDERNSVTAQMMQINADRFNYAETDSLQILEMNYLGGDMSMLVILPDDVDGIHDIEKLLDVQYLNQLKDEMTIQPITVHVPKFEFETSYYLIPHMQSLGINLAFEKYDADFSGITDQQIFISQAVHKTFVGVDEEGTEAAAITALVFRATSGPPTPLHEFVADHPFVFLIQDKETGQILFMGRVMDPTA